MKIHQELQAGWEAIPRLDLSNLQQARMQEAQAMPEYTPIEGVRRTHIEVPASDPPRLIGLDLYTPFEAESMPSVLWIHGGGYILGSAAADADWCAHLARTLRAVVAAVEYRLAPEHPYPAGLEDCYQALVWLTENAALIGINPDRVAVAGSSAGGGLTAALALLARDRGGPQIVFQMPLYPMIDDRNAQPSSFEITSGVWTREHNLAAWRCYLGDRSEVPPTAAPSRANDLTGLPPCYTMVGSIDLFRDETLDYVSRLAQAGVPVECRLVPGGFHAFELIVPDAPISRAARDEYIEALRRGLNDTFC